MVKVMTIDAITEQQIQAKTLEAAAKAGCSLEEAKAAGVVVMNTAGQVVIKEDIAKELEAKAKAKEEAAKAVQTMFAGALGFGAGACCAHFAEKNLGDLSPPLLGKNKSPIFLS